MRWTGWLRSGSGVQGIGLPPYDTVAVQRAEDEDSYVGDGDHPMHFDVDDLNRLTVWRGDELAAAYPDGHWLRVRSLTTATTTTPDDGNAEGG